MSEQNPPPVTVVSEQKRARGGGRPKYKPSDEQRSLVRKLVSEKRSQREISAEVGVSPVTLRKAFRTELDEKVDQAGQLDFDRSQVSVPAESSEAAPGRPEFEPTYRQREDVVLCKADDWSDDRIAQLLGISRNTLLKYFGDELERGADQLRIQVLRNLKMAAGKGSSTAAEKLLRLPGMLGGARQLPTPTPDDDPPEPAPVGKKEQARREARVAEQDTTWAELVRH